MATLHGKSSGRRRTAQPLATVALALAVIGALVLSSASFGYRLGWWDVGTAFTILLASVFAAAAILLLALDALVAGLVARHWAGVGAALVAVGTGAIPLAMKRAAGAVPHIHDVTTDTEHPPEFVALRPLRERVRNGAAYGGAAVAASKSRAART